MTTNSQALATQRRISPEQSKALLATRPKALEVMAARVNVEPAKLLETLKATVFQKANNEELVALVLVANEYGLNPFLKEIYAFPAKGGGIVPVVSIDGWIKITNRHQLFDGLEFEMVDDNEGKPFSCTCIIHIKDRSRPVKVTEYMDECYRETEPWKNMPRRMLRHKALIQTARVAFGFSGIHDDDEAIDIQAQVLTEDPKQITPPAKPAPAPAATPDPTPDTAAAIQDALDASGFTFEQFRQWAGEQKWVTDADSIGSLQDVGEATLKRIARVLPQMVKQLAAMKEATNV